MNIVCYGNSLTAGFPDDLQALRPQDTVTGVSIGGANTQDLIDAFDTNVTPLKSSTLANWLFFWEGIDSINDPPRNSGAQEFALQKTLVSTGRGKGWKVALATIIATTEYSDPGATPYRLPERNAFNTLLRKSPQAADGFCDLNAYPGFGDIGFTNPPAGTLYQADGIHITATGDSVVAARINALLNVLLGGPDRQGFVADPGLFGPLF